MNIKTILVPYDFGEPSESALAAAMDLAEQLDARVVLLHAFELPMAGFPDGVLVASAELASQIIESGDRALAEAVAKYRHRNVGLDTALEQGEPRDVVMRMIEKTGADLVVMGTHGRHGIARALVGSVAEGVVRTSPVPVLTVRAPSAKTEDRSAA